MTFSLNQLYDIFKTIVDTAIRQSNLQNDGYQKLKANYDRVF